MISFEKVMACFHCCSRQSLQPNLPEVAQAARLAREANLASLHFAKFEHVESHVVVRGYQRVVMFKLISSHPSCHFLGAS